MAESEYQLEEKLIETLKDVSYKRVKIDSEKELLANMKKQLEVHNNTEFSDAEFKKIRNYLSSGSVFECAKKLRERWVLERDDKTNSYINFFDTKAWCKNEYQVTNQITINGIYTNRYDVTLLVNGLPLVQIELKRRGMEMKEAFNQIKRYDKHSYSEGFGFFKYVQLFVISNGENTKYFANDNKLDFSFTNFWTDEKNRKINQLMDFAKTFLEPCHVSKMIAKYMALNTQNKLMVLRPYQFYAVEKIEERIKNSNKNGYIWHTTGSGKTLTSFKASQLIKAMPEVDKVIFVVDRNDLDIQTQKEFDFYMKGCVDRTLNTRSLIKKLASTKTEDKLVLTTIQKLDRALKGQFSKDIEYLKDKKVVFIFDECHRSQFGDTHRRIKKFFENNQMIGFTGTPIFDENSNNKNLGYVTNRLFGGDESGALHKYLINDAISDNNVIPFSVDYVGTVKLKDEIEDKKVKSIDTKEVFDSKKRISYITDSIIEIHNTKTKDRSFNAILATSSIPTLIKYYQEFKKRKLSGEHNLRVATIFSYQANEDENANKDAVENDGTFEDKEEYVPHSREYLEEAISDYNKIYNTKFSTDTFREYNDDVSKKVKSLEIDILIVVNMFLTGFDSKKLNTLYVDKNLKYHGLLQAFSRTNRIINPKKSHGNIVCYRPLKDDVDNAIKLFSNTDADQSKVIMKRFEAYVFDFQEQLAKVKNIALESDDVVNINSEEGKAKFIITFRELLRIMNILDTFVEFSFDTIGWTEEEFNAYKSQYLDIKESISKDKDSPESILKDIDFEVSYLFNDIIDVDYIISLLSRIETYSSNEKERIIKTLAGKIDTQENLRSKKDLILEFVDKLFANKEKFNVNELKKEYDNFFNDKSSAEFEKLAKDFNIDVRDLEDIKISYDFKGYFEKDKIKEVLSKNKKYSFLERKNLSDKIMDNLVLFTKRFER